MTNVSWKTLKVLLHFSFSTEEKFNFKENIWNYFFVYVTYLISFMFFMFLGIGFYNNQLATVLLETNTDVFTWCVYSLTINFTILKLHLQVE